MNLSDEVTKPELPKELLMEDRWVVSQYNRLVKEVTENLEGYELGVAAQKIYDFLWDVLCDWYIEISKARLQAGGETSLNAQKVLVYVLANTLKLLHPFMPFITEEIWQSIPNDCETIMMSKFPEYMEELNFIDDEREFTRIMDAIKAIRNVRTEKNIPPSKKSAIYVETEYVDTFNKGAAFFERLASASEVNVGASFDVANATLAVTDSCKVHIPMGDLIDKDKELERLNREKAACETDIKVISGKLNNEGFVARAPEKVVAGEREKLARAEERMEKILESIKALG